MTSFIIDGMRQGNEVVTMDRSPTDQVRARRPDGRGGVRTGPTSDERSDHRSDDQIARRWAPTSLERPYLIEVQELGSELYIG
jgi:hypothetical protein